MSPLRVQHTEAESAKDTGSGDRRKSKTKLAIWPPWEVWPDAPGTFSKTSFPELNVPLPGSLPRVCPVSQEQVELQDPKASEAEG